MANNGSICSRAKGTVNLECVEGDVAVEDVMKLEVSDLAANLLSVGKICDKDFNDRQGRVSIANSTEKCSYRALQERGSYRLNRWKVNKAYTVTDMTM